MVLPFDADDKTDTGRDHQPEQKVYLAELETLGLYE